jgi:hypothetical protein
MEKPHFCLTEFWLAESEEPMEIHPETVCHFLPARGNMALPCQAFGQDLSKKWK